MRLVARHALRDDRRRSENDDGGTRGELVDLSLGAANCFSYTPAGTRCSTMGWAYEDHPWLADEVAEWAVEPGLNMIGTDTFSPDMPIERRADNANFGYPVHRTLLGNDVLIIEHLVNLAAVSGERGHFWAFPVYTLEPGGDAGHVVFVWEALDE